MADSCMHHHTQWPGTVVLELTLKGPVDTTGVPWIEGRGRGPHISYQCHQGIESDLHFHYSY